MFAKAVAGRYAQAALNEIAEFSVVEAVSKELETLARAFESQPVFREFLLNPSIVPALKAGVVERALSGKIRKETLGLLKLLILKNRQVLLPDVAASFHELYVSARGIDQAEVISAVPLPSDLETRLISAIQRFGNEVKVTVRVDPSIIGGLIVRIGDRVIDASMKRRFEDVRRALLSLRLPPASTGEK